MKNYVGREIPDSLLVDGKEVYRGKNYRDGRYFVKSGPRVRVYEKQESEKMVDSIHDALVRCGIKDGMTVSFHHHFRDGDYTVNAVMAEIAAMGVKDITIAASSLSDVHAPLVDYIEQGVVTGIQTSGIRGKLGAAVSHGKLSKPVIIRSHGGRVRAIEEGDVHIDIAFVAAATSDISGNASGKGGKSECGMLAYSYVDSKYADNVVVITDTIVDFPNFPASIQAIDVDCVVKVDKVGDPEKIVSNAVRYTTDPKELAMAENCAKVMAATPYFKDGFSFQTGGGGPSLAVNRFLEPLMLERGIKMGWALGGISAPMVELLEKGLVRTVVNTQAFDSRSIQSVNSNPKHFEISTSQYANPANKGAFVSKLDFGILGALEVDQDFNVNVVVGSDGVLRGAPGGHPDMAAGAKCSIIVTPIVRKRMPIICDHVISVTTPGECVDVVVTDHGIAVNPARKDVIEWLDAAGIEHVTISELRDMAYRITGTPDEIEWEDKVVAVIEARDGTILDVVKQVKPYSFE